MWFLILWFSSGVKVVDVFYHKGSGERYFKAIFQLPLFIGETSKEEWKRRLLEYPGPWGELATDNIILTVPTANLRTLENPEPLLRLWDEMMQAVAKLGGETFPLRLPQRIVADVQISVGGCSGSSVCLPPRTLSPQPRS